MLPESALSMNDGMMPGADPMMGYGEVLPFPTIEPPEHVVELQRRVIRMQQLAQMPNAAEAIDDVKLSDIGRKVVREYQIDRNSRESWEKRAKLAMDIALQEQGENTADDVSNVKYPLLTTAALQFAARAYPAIVDGPSVVKCQVMGADPDGQKSASAERVSAHMSYQLLNETEWESDVDTLLHQLPVVGCAFKKVYRDGGKPAGFCDELISAFDLVVNQSAKDLATVPRITHVFPLYPHEIAERQRMGTFSEVDLRGEAKDGDDDDSPHSLLEQHRYIDLDDDGVAEPWIVTVHERTEQVLRIVPCFDPAEVEVDMMRGKIIRIPRREYFVKIPFIPDPKGGFYDLGFGHLLAHVNAVIDTAVNQMLDAASLQNAGGGFIGGGVDLGKGKSEIRVKRGEYRTVRTPGPDLRQSIVNLDHPGPSKTSLDLLQLMLEAGKDIASVQDILVGDAPKVQTATTTMAIIEQGLKVFTAIYKRIFRALKKEFRLIFDINKVALDQPKYFQFQDQEAAVVQADYQGAMDIMPVSDPNNITDMQRMAKAQMALEAVKEGNPHVNPFEATKRAFEAARIERLDELLIPPPPPDAPKPPSPEEEAARVDIEAKQAAAQMKQQEAAAAFEAKQADAMLRLQEREQQMMLKLEEKAADFERKQREADLAHETQLRALQLKNDELDQKWSALQMREREARMKHEAATETSESDAD